MSVNCTITEDVDKFKRNFVSKNYANGSKLQQKKDMLSTTNKTDLLVAVATFNVEEPDQNRRKQQTLQQIAQEKPISEAIQNYRKILKICG